MTPSRKPTRRAQVRALFYNYLRQETRAKLRTATAKYGSHEYEAASWTDSYCHGCAHGVLELAQELGVITWDEAMRLRERHSRVDDAASKRWHRLIDKPA
jgi:hypothetical protein